MSNSGDNFFEYLLQQFEQYLQGKHHIHFDSDDFADIIDHFLTLDQIDLAEKALKIGLQYYPNDTELLTLFAKLLHQKGKTSKAIKLLEELRENQIDEDLEVSFQLIEILLDVRNYEKAMQILEEIYPKCEDIDDKKYVLHEIIHATRATGKHSITIKYIHELLKIEPDNPTLLENLCFAYIQARKIQQGINFFQQYTDKHPFNPTGWFLLGFLFLQSQNDEFINQSNQAFQFALSINPHYYDAAIQLANNYLNENNAEKALQILKDLPYNENYQTEFDEIYAKASLILGEYDKAIELFHKLLHQTDDINYHTYLSVAYYNTERYELSYDHIKKYVERSDDIAAEILFLKAMIELEIGKPEDALDTFDKSLETLSQDEFVWINFSTRMLQLYENYFETIILLLEEGFFLTFSAHVALQLAAILYTYGKLSKAEHWLRTGLEINKSAIETLYEFNPQLQENSDINQIINSYI